MASVVKNSHPHQWLSHSLPNLSSGRREPMTNRQDSGLALTLVESPVSEDFTRVEDESKAVGGGYSSKKAKQEDIHRRSSLLQRIKDEGKMSVLDPLHEHTS